MHIASKDTMFRKILFIVLIYSTLDINVEACGGCSTCDLTADACVPTEVRTIKKSQSSGWWFTKKTKYFSEYQYYTGTPYCCTGYKLSGLTCTADILTCGGCVGTDITEQPACTQFVQQKQSRSATVAYSCNGWWGWLVTNKCYREDIYYELVRLTINTCCAGFNLQGAKCIIDTTPPPCGRSKYHTPGALVQYIVGGAGARPNEFPWQLRLSVAGSGMCGATLVGSEWALTAAHCVGYFIGNPSAIAVIAGDHRYKDYDDTEQIRYASAVFVHSAFSTVTYENDIAIIKLNEPLSLSSDVTTACLPVTCDVNYDDTDVIISGWGRSSAGRYTSTTERFNELQYAWMKVKPLSYCERYFGSMGTFLCASDGLDDTEKSPCFGDSGGPMVTQESDGRFTVIGVASFVADRGCAEGLPSGYTDVRPYLGWIKQIMF